MNTLEIDDAYRRYFPTIRAKCRRMIAEPAEAEDVAQETFVRLWNSRAELRDGGAVAAWIYRTATRLAVDRMRRRAVHDRHQFTLEANQRGLDLDPERRAALVQFLGALAAKLPRRELEITLLSRIDGLDTQEIAALFALSERSVRRILQQADARMQTLRQELVG